MKGCQKCDLGRDRASEGIFSYKIDDPTIFKDKDHEWQKHKKAGNLEFFAIHKDSAEFPHPRLRRNVLKYSSVMPAIFPISLGNGPTSLLLSINIDRMAVIAPNSLGKDPVN
jgi:hypothetical protein